MEDDDSFNLPLKILNAGLLKGVAIIILINLIEKFKIAILHMKSTECQKTHNRKETLALLDYDFY